MRVQSRRLSQGYTPGVQLQYALLLQTFGSPRVARTLVSVWAIRSRRPVMIEVFWDGRCPSGAYCRPASANRWSSCPPPLTECGFWSAQREAVRGYWTNYVDNVRQMNHLHEVGDGQDKYDQPKGWPTYLSLISGPHPQSSLSCQSRTRCLVSKPQKVFQRSSGSPTLLLCESPASSVRAGTNIKLTG